MFLVHYSRLEELMVGLAGEVRLLLSHTSLSMKIEFLNDRQRYREEFLRQIIEDPSRPYLRYIILETEEHTV